MLEFSSRYYTLPTKIYYKETGEQIPYKSRRFIPSADQLQPLTTVTVKDGDRIDLIAAQVFGDPLLFWRLCDGNDIMHPLELIETIGQKIEVKIIQDEPAS